MENIKAIKNIWLFCIYFLNLTGLLTLICLVSNWVEMWERKRALIGSYFSKVWFNDDRMAELIAVALKVTCVNPFGLVVQNL